MISREELELLISGTVSQSGLAIEAVAGRRLTRTETDELGRVIATAMRLVAERCHAQRVPPPPPAPPPAPRARLFEAMRTQEFPKVTEEAIHRATELGTPVVKPK